MHGVLINYLRRRIQFHHLCEPEKMSSGRCVIYSRGSQLIDVDLGKSFLTTARCLPFQDQSPPVRTYLGMQQHAPYTSGKQADGDGQYAQHVEIHTLRLLARVQSRGPLRSCKQAFRSTAVFPHIDVWKFECAVHPTRNLDNSAAADQPLSRALGRGGERVGLFGRQADDASRSGSECRRLRGEAR